MNVVLLARETKAIALRKARQLLNPIEEKLNSDRDDLAFASQVLHPVVPQQLSYGSV